MEQTTVNQEIDFTRINNDTNGNPRYVCHFFNLMTHEEKLKDMDIHDQYLMALNRAKKIGGRKFHNKQFGGGIVFQSYSKKELTSKINDLLK